MNTDGFAYALENAQLSLAPPWEVEALRSKSFRSYLFCEWMRCPWVKQLAAMLAAAAMLACTAEAQDTQPLKFVRAIPLPDVKGRIDHFAADVGGQRLFVCALGNDSVEVIDLKAGQRIHSIKDLGAPQGVAYVPETDRLVVANERGGRVNVYQGKSFEPAGSVDLKDDADNVRYDAAAKRVYVGYGSGALGVLDAQGAKVPGNISLAAHPESFQLEQKGPRIFVNVPSARQVAVIDRGKGETIATWDTGDELANFPMALDEGNARLFIGCRTPAKLVVLDANSGKVVASLGISGDTDDVFYDAKRQRIYAICGAGSIEVIRQRDADHYALMATIKTASGARAGLFIPELNTLYVGVPRRGNRQAEIRQYTPQ